VSLAAGDVAPRVGLKGTGRKDVDHADLRGAVLAALTEGRVSFVVLAVPAAQVVRMDLGVVRKDDAVREIGCAIFAWPRPCWSRQVFRKRPTRFANWASN